MSLTDEDKQWFGERLDTKLTSLEGSVDSKLGSLEGRLDTKLASLEGRINAKLDRRFEAFENHMTEVMRDMQSEFLRGFAAFSQSHTIRLNRVESNQLDMDKALSGRVQILEGRLLQIELRLFGELGPGVKPASAFPRRGDVPTLPAFCRIPNPVYRPRYRGLCRPAPDELQSFPAFHVRAERASYAGWLPARH